MATRLLISRTAKKKPASNSSTKKETPRTQPKFLSHNLFEKFKLTKSPTPNFPKHFRSLFSHKDFPFSPVVPELKSRRKSSFKLSIHNFKLVSMPLNKIESLRYSKSSLEGSYRNFNAISTPPEENQRSHSINPFSEFIDKQLSVYMNSPLTQPPELDLAKKTVEIKYFQRQSKTNKDSRVKKSKNRHHTNTKRLNFPFPAEKLNPRSFPQLKKRLIK